ncbi:Hypothetical predicted protein [Scomber scombrus]|uniref:Uncharacterized protein n=1 Tax=Scomber scombrus TaxID=13677 RepID=A0AAV1Q0V9_SCOSC
MLFPPPGLHTAWKSHLLFQTESSFRGARRPSRYSVNRGNLRAVINAADPVQRRCILAQATIQQRAQASAVHFNHILHRSKQRRLHTHHHQFDSETKLRP